MRCLLDMAATTTITMRPLQFMRSNESHAERIQLEDGNDEKPNIGRRLRNNPAVSVRVGNDLDSSGEKRVMTYHSLSECTLTDYERWEEKNRIVQRIEHNMENATDKERDFIAQMSFARTVSVKQLFYLRDIAEKY